MDPFDLRHWAGFTAAGGNPTAPAIVDQVAIDSRRIDSKNALFVPLEGNVFNGHRFISQANRAGAIYTLAKKGWSSSEPLDGLTVLYVDNPLRAFQEIAGAYRRQLPCKVVGIAGSYGKTMVKDLLQAILSIDNSVVASPESFNSQIGVALSILTIKKEHQVALIEAAISQKDEMDHLNQIVQADYGILTHIGKKHLSTLGDLKTAASEMVKLFSLMPSKSWVVLPEDANLQPHIGKIKAQSIFWNTPSPELPHASFSSKERAAHMSYQVHYPDGKVYLGQTTSGFYYFLDLINITVKAAWLLGASSEEINATLRAYTPEPMRTEIWKSPIGTTFINDTYCSDPQSVDTALKYMQQSPPNHRKIFVFGGMRGKQLHAEVDYRRVGKAIHRADIDLLLLYGQHPFKSLIAEVKQLSPKTEIAFADTYKDALGALREKVSQNDFVLIKGEQKHSIDQLTETFNDSICSNQCIINLAAIAENLTTLRQKLPPHTRIMVMVKAFGYGTDEVRMAKFLETRAVDILGVSYVDEGVALKRAGVKQAIFVINTAIYETAKVVKWDLEVGVSNKALIESIAAEAAKHNKKIKMHLHIDTGMGRFGCRPEEALELARLIASHPALEFEGVMTHFACADDPDQDAFTIFQAQTLDKVDEQLKAHGLIPRWVHAANSSGAMRFKFPQFNMVRIGLAVYGLYPSQATKDALELRLAFSLISRIVGINTLKQGETISYGRSYSVQRDFQQIAVLPIGYFDGLHRNYSGKGHVIVRGFKAPMVGKICMDFMMIDVTDVPNAATGDSVLIFGEDEYGQYLSPEELATRGDSIVHELITCLGPRIQRIFVHEEKQVLH